MYKDESVRIPYIDDFSLEYLDKLQEYFILDKKTRTSCHGYVEYLRVSPKGMNPRKAQ